MYVENGNYMYKTNMFLKPKPKSEHFANLYQNLIIKVLKIEIKSKTNMWHDARNWLLGLKTQRDVKRQFKMESLE